MGGQKTVLVVEDAKSMREMLAAALGASGYHVVQAELAQAGLQLFLQSKPDLVVLDVNLPDGNGIDICRKMREHRELGSVPIIILTARAEPDSKLDGFTAGADQYLVKPLPPDEFMLWVEAIFKRHEFYQGESRTLSAGPLRIDLDTRTVTWENSVIDDLTSREFDLLYFLVKRRPKIVSRETIIDHLWKIVANDHLVDVHVSNMRKKMPPALSNRIVAVQKSGYCFRE